MATGPGQKERESLWRLLKLARAEDLGDSGDVTGSLLPVDVGAVGRFVARQPMIFCGGELLETVAITYDGALRTSVTVAEAAAVDAGQELAVWRGPARSMMAAERVALNFLQKLSAVATITSKYVEMIADTGAKIYDTRKTTPGWRELEKYAVRVGGGKNHRMGLYDAVLIKDNHLAVLAKAEGEDPVLAVGRELDRIRPFLGEGVFIELEVDTLDQFAVALSLPVDIVLLDNMSLDDLSTAVEMRSRAGLAKTLALEASGGICLDTVRQVAQTGVERIAVGALTHSAGAVDIALDIEVD